MKLLTKRQTLFVLTIVFLANKAQRLPGFVASTLGRHGWMVTLFLGLIDTALLAVMLWANRINKAKTGYGLIQSAFGSVVAKIISFLLVIYFLINAVLPYEAVHDVFSNVLFDYLSWELYSAFIIFAVAFLACFGLKTIGRVSELFIWLIVLSLTALLILGATTTSFARTLPLCDVNFKEVIKTSFNFSMWFGDFTILYVMFGRIKEDDGKLGFWLVLASIGVVVLMTFGYMIFYGLYGFLAPEQTNAISSISQFSLLNLDIGRVDWFLILFFEMSAFVSSAVYIYCASVCFSKVFNIKNEKWMCVIFTVLMYVLDLSVFKSVGRGASKLATYTRYFYPFVVMLLPFELLISAYIVRAKNKKKLKGSNIKSYAVLFAKPQEKYVCCQNKEKQSSLQKLRFKNINKKEKCACKK